MCVYELNVTILPCPFLPRAGRIQQIKHDGFPLALLHHEMPAMSQLGHVWTVPAVQEESDYQRSVRVRSCIRPVLAWRITSVAMQPLWPLALM
jgi:hypothetical protein